MSNYGITGTDLAVERQEHYEDCKARFREYDLSDCDCDRPAPTSAPAQVWCDKCDQPATTSIHLTSGETAFRCSTDAWLIRGPRTVFA